MRGQLCPSSLLSWSPLHACGAQPCGHRSSPRPPPPFSLSSPNGGSRLSTSVGAAWEPAGAAAALEPPGASAPGWDPGTAPAQGGHPGFWCDPACQGLGGGRQPTWAACLRAVAVLWSQLSCATGSTLPGGAGLGCAHNAPAAGKPGACSPGGNPSPRALVGGRQWRCLPVPAGDVLPAIWPCLGHLSPSGEQISTPKGLSSQIIPSAHANSTQRRGVWCKVPVPTHPSRVPRSQGW